MKGDALLIGAILAIVIFSASSSPSPSAKSAVDALPDDERKDLIKRAAKVGRTPENQLRIEKHRGM